jgi:hypothetical protein
MLRNTRLVETAVSFIPVFITNPEVLRPRSPAKATAQWSSFAAGMGSSMKSAAK